MLFKSNTHTHSSHWFMIFSFFFVMPILVKQSDIQNLVKKPVDKPSITIDDDR